MFFFKNESATDFLEKMFRPQKRLIQNLLFWGEESVGKMTTARAFSNALLCGNNDKWELCHQCPNCQMLDQGYHPDLMIIEPLLDKDDKEGKSIKIEQAREGIKFLTFHPQIADLKILIINQAELLTRDAQDALLKTLEESRKNNLIILVTKAPKKLTTTIHSRLLSLRFKRASSKSLIDFLQKEHGLSLKESQMIAERAEGKIGLAIKLMDKDYTKSLEEKRKDLVKVLTQDFNQRSVYFQKLTKDNKELNATLEEWLRMLRSNRESGKLNLTPVKKTKLTNDILKAIYLLNDSNINTQLLMENIFLQLK
ncbi:MAG: hypothetical protein PHG13_02310 [Candidatus Pacebacteria bacterium]|nr:hypothetical protein [Candidatus Paceibacterota bacterium]MDD5721812.1 hypothetical protein [Candidatus Paceibacterota bacterium]